MLGLDHSGDNDDAMAVVLQPGVRKLWSETDLAKLNEIKSNTYNLSSLVSFLPISQSIIPPTVYHPGKRAPARQWRAVRDAMRI